MTDSPEPQAMDSAFRECEVCQYEGTTYYNPQFLVPSDAKKWLGGWLCGICMATPAAHAFAMPDHYRGQTETLFAISYATNMILDAILTGKDPRIP